MEKYIRWKNIFHANGKQKKAGVAILISDKIDLKIKKTIRNKEGHYIMIKGSIQEEDITIVLSQKKECLCVSFNEVDEPRTYYTK